MVDSGVGSASAIARPASGGIYVFAILGRESALPSGLCGFGDTPLRVIPYRALAAATSTVDSVDLKPTPEHVLRHESVVEAIREAAPALPVRFGTILGDEVAVARALADRHELLTADLRRIGDKVEMGLSVLWDPESIGSRVGESAPSATRAELVGVAVPGRPPTHERAGTSPAPTVGDTSGRPPTSPMPSSATSSRQQWRMHEPGQSRGPGTSYLLARFAEHIRTERLKEEARALARDLDDRLREHTVASLSKILPTRRLALNAAYLVERARLEGFRRAFDALRQTYPNLRLLMSGPWPPYSFVSPAEQSNADGPLTVSGVSGSSGAMKRLRSDTDKAVEAIEWLAREE